MRVDEGLSSDAAAPAGALSINEVRCACVRVQLARAREPTATRNLMGTPFPFRKEVDRAFQKCSGGIACDCANTFAKFEAPGGHEAAKEAR